MENIKFLDKVTCKMTKRIGVVYGIATYLYESDQFMVLFEGEKETVWVTVNSVDVVIE